MSQKPTTEKEIWTEREICARLGLRINDKTGRSTQLTNWVKAGLPFVERSNNRYFFENDFIDFLWSRRVDKTPSG